MKILSNSPLLDNLLYEDLVEFLRNIGWQQTETSDHKWLMFLGASDIDGNPIEIVIPSDGKAPDIRIYLANAINSLSAITENDVDEIIEEIKFYDRDILKVRNPVTGDSDSISLRIAAQQIFELKQLVAYSACSEESPKPFFINSQRPIARRMVEQYRFGHTFRGSFGFTIETPHISQDAFGIQKSLIPEIKEDEPHIPVSRLVMERIVRGLVLARDATSERDVNLIIGGYEYGLNSNMCMALVNMSLGKELPLEYTISWSKVFPPSDDNIRNPGVIRLGFSAYDHLKYAAKMLSELEPESVTITGVVTDLSAKDNPLGLDTSRSIIIRWYDEIGGKTNNVFVELEKEDYFHAIRAHEEWLSVTISGTLRRIKRNWRLVDYHDLTVERGFEE